MEASIKSSGKVWNRNGMLVARNSLEYQQHYAMGNPLSAEKGKEIFDKLEKFGIRFESSDHRFIFQFAGIHRLMQNGVCMKVTNLADNGWEVEVSPGKCIRHDTPLPNTVRQLETAVA